MSNIADSSWEPPLAPSQRIIETIATALEWYADDRDECERDDDGIDHDQIRKDIAEAVDWTTKQYWRKREGEA